jgi:hypothetical protein
MPFADVLEESHAEASSRLSDGVINARRAIDNILKPAWGSWPISAIGPHDCLELAQELLGCRSRSSHRTRQEGWQATFAA